MQIDAFLRLTNADDQMVEGESTDLSYAKHIEIRDFALCSGSSEAQVSLGDIGADHQTQLVMEMWDKAQAMQERIKQRQDREREKQEKIEEEIKQRAKRGIKSTLQEVSDYVARRIAKQAVPVKKDVSQDNLGFQIKKDVDSASADLFQAYCATVIQPNPNKQYRKLGQFATAEVTLRKMFDGKARPYLFCSFRDVTIDSYSVSFDSSRGHMMETVTFKFNTYRMKYQSQTAEGKAGTASDISGTVTGKTE
ncbi:type VI secretion system tube protein Hcp [Limnoglobus roseus]|uniref:Uncharacterized protein n=1 Tax=Limnoglobus roseus TaxID=2598579 RepID=A0A5C1AMU0_9BACT|nr:type VI secretion system tube protein Hcp [Limnoglobus roseus]QEL19457.1 hypothetical protein PX52LOC_06529 [Limnoglobus roseus]